MAYHTPLYLLVFLPVTLMIYQLMPQKHRWKVLLLFSYVFFWLFSGLKVMISVAITVLSYGFGRWIGYVKNSSSMVDNDKKLGKKKEKLILMIGIVTIVGILGYFKYSDFVIESMNRLMGFHIIESKVAHSSLVPIGISFYSLQAISYMVDVYWGKSQEEKNVGKYALYLSFFPQLMEGPIASGAQTMDALSKGDSLKYQNVFDGSLRILWGLFKKMIIADRLNILVNVIFDGYKQYQGIVVITAAIAYTIQLYMEFSGSIDIVIGSGRMFGVILPENFRQPFASRSASEFWNRWHITLGKWFKTYIFYPVSTSGLIKKCNRYGKKHMGKYMTRLLVSACCLFPVWLCNGLWHGPKWTYIIYGMYYFIILLLEIALEPVGKKIVTILNIDDKSVWWNAICVLKTWCIIFTGELIFRSGSMKSAIYMIQSVFQGLQIEKLYDGSMLLLGLDQADFIVIILGCLCVWIVGMLRERKIIDNHNVHMTWKRSGWMVIYTLIVMIVIFGAYGTGYQIVDLIYAGF